VDGGWPVPKRASKKMNALQSDSVKLHENALPKPEGLLLFLYECSNDVERQLGLPDSIFGLAPGLLLRVADELDLLR
jgi:hypothetical protein